MKKIFLVPILILAFLPVAFADEGGDSAAENPEKLVPMHTQKSPSTPNEELVSLDLSRSMGRIEDLRRRINSLEQENRFQDERIRNLERTVSDLQRRR